MDWAQRLSRVFGMRRKSLPLCGGSVWTIACIEDQVVIIQVSPHVETEPTRDSSLWIVLFFSRLNGVDMTTVKPFSLPG